MAFIVVSLIVLGILWILLLRCLRIQWRINSPWYAVLGLYWFVFSYLRLMWSFDSASIMTWMPILVMVYETVAQSLLSRVLIEGQNNDVEMLWCSLAIFNLSEGMRFLSFVVVCMDGLPHEIILNVLMSLIGEIWINTQVCQLAKNEVSMRLFGTPANSCPDLREAVTSSRFHMEYVTPVWFFSALFFFYAPDNDRNANFIKVDEIKWDISGAYLLQELAAEVICHCIRKKSGYKRRSAVGEIKFHVQFMIVVAFFVFFEMHFAFFSFGLL